MFLLKCFLVNACKGGISPGGVVRKKRMQRFGLTTDRTAIKAAPAKGSRRQFVGR